MDKQLELLYNKLGNKENFSLVRFGDGEYNIIHNIACDRNGFDFSPTNEDDQRFRAELKESLVFQGKNYYKGITDFSLLHDLTDVISACVFVNENYLDFLLNFSPLFENCLFVGNECGDSEALPFKPKKYIKVKNNAWKDYNSNLLSLYLSRHLENVQNEVILVACGPMANSLICKLYKNNPQNTYINIGSVYDPFLYGTKTRQYQKRLDK